MKKNYVYFVAPLVGLILFSGIYWKYSASYDARMEEMHRKERQATQAKLDEDAKNREIAAKAAFKAQEERKAARKAKEEKDIRDKEMRDQAQQAMRKAQNEARNLAQKIQRLKKDVDEEKKQVDIVAQEKTRLISEEAFQHEYKLKAEANVQTLTATLDTIADADKKWAEYLRELARQAAAKK